MDRPPLHIQTPLLWSQLLSEETGANVWLKMECVQNSSSYKVRGIGRLCQLSVERGCVQFISSSGGNAGLAAAYCARELNVPITVVVPECTPAFMVEKIRRVATKVEVVGKAWDDANERAKELASKPGSVLIHPFDHPDIWEGHASLVVEAKEQMKGGKPDVVILSVGGGGLMSGVLQGMHDVGWGDVPLLAMETAGADSFNACVKAGDWVELKEITSIAKTLGAKRVCKRAYDWISQHQIISRVISDREAVSACLKIADDHRVLVSPACGAALAAVYGDVLTQLQTEGTLPRPLSNVLVVVCGGNEVTLKEIELWKKQFDL